MISLVEALQKLEDADVFKIERSGSAMVFMLKRGDACILESITVDSLGIIGDKFIPEMIIEMARTAAKLPQRKDGS